MSRKGLENERKRNGTWPDIDVYTCIIYMHTHVYTCTHPATWLRNLLVRNSASQTQFLIFTFEALPNRGNSLSPLGLTNSKNMDPRAFRVEKHGSARFSGRKTWIRALFGSKNMDPRVFRIEKHGSARFSDRGGYPVFPVVVCWAPREKVLFAGSVKKS